MMVENKNYSRIPKYGSNFAGGTKSYVVHLYCVKGIRPKRVLSQGYQKKIEIISVYFH